MTLEQQTAIMDKVSVTDDHGFCPGETVVSNMISRTVLQPHHRVPTWQASSRHRRALVSPLWHPRQHTRLAYQPSPPTNHTRGSRWESSQEGAELMLKYGLEYDHSFSHHDCQCYWLRTGDKWIPIDYEKHPDHWMKPLEAGVTTGLCEIPASWYADDLPPMMFIVRGSPSCPKTHLAVAAGTGQTVRFADRTIFVLACRKKPPTATAG
jgi:hypothetical protein